MDGLMINRSVFFGGINGADSLEKAVFRASPGLLFTPTAISDVKSMMT